MPNRDLVSSTVMIHWYIKNGLLEEARALFDQTPEKDVVCWTMMINGYTQKGKAHEALLLFREMQLEEKVIKPDGATFKCVLSACTQLGNLELGRWMHCYLINRCMIIKQDVKIGSCLINMYAKCGSLDEAVQVFDEMKHKGDIVVWNAMITGYAMHGCCKEALELFQRLKRRQGLKPTYVTFLAVLSACNHCGSIDKGYEIFKSMKKDYGIEPRIEHYGCMVDLLSRMGHVEEAYDLIKTMQVKPDNAIWGALLTSCRLHGKMQLAEHVASIILVENDDKVIADSGIYSQLSNLYSAGNKWSEAAYVRAMRTERGIRKEPGYSR